MLLGFLEALVFGLPVLRRASARLGTSPWPVYLAIGWLLVSWWPHNHLHQTISPADLNALLGIEYGFHVSLFVVGLVLAWFFPFITITFPMSAPVRSLSAVPPTCAAWDF